MIIALDTNAYTDFRRSKRWSSIIQRASSIVIPFVVLAELRSGFRLGSKAGANEAKLRDFLENALVNVIYPNDSTTEYYAEYLLFLRRQGTPIPTNDLWIAALCGQHQFTLASADQHFRQLPQLSLAVESDLAE